MIVRGIPRESRSSSETLQTQSPGRKTGAFVFVLAQLVGPLLGADPLCGSLFVFLSRGARQGQDPVVGSARVLARLQAPGAGALPCSRDAGQRVGLSSAELMLWLEGVDLTRTRRLERGAGEHVWRETKRLAFVSSAGIMRMECRLRSCPLDLTALPEDVATRSKTSSSSSPRSSNRSSIKFSIFGARTSQRAPSG